jgi:hypothetical protein
VPVTNSTSTIVLQKDETDQRKIVFGINQIANRISKFWKDGIYNGGVSGGAGGITVSPPASTSAQLILNKPASGLQDVLTGQTAGKNRWEMVIGNTTGETGSNAGSDFALWNDDDTGARISANPALFIQRATGQVQINGAPLAPALPGYIGGLTLSNFGSGTPVINIDKGGATSDDNTTTMIMPSAFAKNFGGTWNPGYGAGGMDVGVIPVNGWIHVFLIYNPTTQATDILGSLNPGPPGANPTLPTGWTKQRRIGSVKSVSSAILAFTQFGDHFLFNSAIVEITGVTISTTNVVQTLAGVPSGVRVQAQLEVQINPVSGGNAIILITSPDMGAQTVDLPGAIHRTLGYYSTGSLTGGGATILVRTNATAQVQLVAASGVNVSAYITTIGWIDNRGK